MNLLTEKTAANIQTFFSELFIMNVRLSQHLVLFRYFCFLSYIYNVEICSALPFIKQISISK